jgi:hypothetical protein
MGPLLIGPVIGPELIAPRLTVPLETRAGDTTARDTGAGAIDTGAMYELLGAAAGVEYRIDAPLYALPPIAAGGVVFGRGR